MHLKKIISAFLLMAFVSAGAFAQKVEKVGPLNVVPGILVSVSGSGFGGKGAVTCGAVAATDIVYWADDNVIFRAPAGIKTGDVVSVKGAKADPAKYAFQALDPATAVKVRWIVDTSKVNDSQLSADQKAKIKGGLKFTPPLNLKGEWVKAGNAAYGTYDNMWDGGALQRMWNQGGSIWVAEVAFSPANIATMVNTQGKPKAMKFAFEDGNLTRNVVEFESDWAFALKKGWAKTDKETTTHSDPAVKLDKSYWFDGSYIVCKFPAN